MPRAVWKGPFVDGSVLKLVDAARRGLLPKETGLKTTSRATTIIPQFVGLTFHIHNGRKYLPLTVVQEMIGHRFGEFAGTRTFYGHKDKDKKKKK